MRTIRNKHSRGDIELNSQSLGIVEIFYLGDTIARRGARSSVIERIRSEWSKFRDLVTLFNQ